MPGLGFQQVRIVGGGPADSFEGEVPAPPPDWLYFGADSGFCYRLDTHATPRRRGGKTVALYRYDRAATREKLQLLGLPLASVELALASDAEVRAMAAAPSIAEGLRSRPELGGYEVDVRIELHEDEWQVWVAGDLQQTVPRGEIDPDDVDRIRELAQTAGSEFIAHNTSQEAAS